MSTTKQLHAEWSTLNLSVAEICRDAKASVGRVPNIDIPERPTGAAATNSGHCVG